MSLCYSRRILWPLSLDWYRYLSSLAIKEREDVNRAQRLLEAPRYLFIYKKHLDTDQNSRFIVFEEERNGKEKEVSKLDTIRSTEERDNLLNSSKCNEISLKTTSKETDVKTMIISNSDLTT